MLDPRLLRLNPEAAKQATQVKSIPSPEMVEAWLAADERRRQSQAEGEILRAGDLPAA